MAERRFEELKIADVAACAAVVLAGDNLALTVAASQRACALGQTIVQGGLHGPTGVVQIRRAAAVEEKERACPCCLWDASERRELDHQTRFACDGSGRGPANPGGPTGALSALGGLAGSLLAFELLQWALGIAGADAIVEYCALSHRAVVSPLVPKPSCLVPHARWRRVEVARPLGELSPGQIFALARARSASRREQRSLEVDGLSWASLGLCDCTSHAPVDRFVRRADPAGTSLGSACERCGRALWIHPFHTRVEAPGALFTNVLERPLAELGAAGARAAIVRGASSAVLILGPEAHARGPVPALAGGDEERR